MESKHDRNIRVSLANCEREKAVPPLVRIISVSRQQTVNNGTKTTENGLTRKEKPDELRKTFD